MYLSITGTHAGAICRCPHCMSDWFQITLGPHQETVVQVHWSRNAPLRCSDGMSRDRWFEEHVVRCLSCLTYFDLARKGEELAPIVSQA